LALNISGTTAADPRWYPQITAILAGNRGVTDRLIIEITETVALSDLQETRQFVEQLRSLGCTVAIDDFGAGYTSFRNLRALPVDILKIDGSFCRDLKDNADNGYFVRSLIDLAHTLNLQTVAEWVENEEDGDLLREWGIDFLQGNIFGEASLKTPWPEMADAGNFATAVSAEPAMLDPSEPVADLDVLQTFEEGLPGEVSNLRQAIAALDASFRRGKPDVNPEPFTALSNTG
ncbi:MAG TPA: EAL domain-containing protein, partial [Aestuariivirga sp.]|nr:EAL domain-containing protein [Aestuariivirga sp.]